MHYCKTITDSFKNYSRDAYFLLLRVEKMNFTLNAASILMEIPEIGAGCKFK